MNNYADENRQIEEDDDDDINMIGGSAEDTCLTIGEYEGQMMLNVFSDIKDGEVLAQSCSKQPERQMKNYNLRPRPAIQKAQLKVNTGKRHADPNLDLNIPTQNQLPIKKSAVEVSTSIFSFELELSKIKVPVPLLELLKNLAYKESFQKLLQPTIPAPDAINLEDERPEIYLGSLVQN